MFKESEKFMEQKQTTEQEQVTETGLEKEKIPESIITAYVLRHGESPESHKKDQQRVLTEKGMEQPKEAVKKIVEEIISETDPKTEIELRGYDSGLSRTNQTIIEVAKTLTKMSYQVYLPHPTYKLYQDMSTLEEREKEGLVNGKGPGIGSRIRPIKFPAEAREKIAEEAKEKDQTSLFNILTSPPEKLKGMGMETPQDAFQRIESGIEQTNRIAQGLRRKNPHRKIIAIAVSHDVPIASYLMEKFKIDPKELAKIPNCEGFRVDFSGESGDKPRIKPWGEGMEKKMTKI